MLHVFHTHYCYFFHVNPNIIGRLNSGHCFELTSQWTFKCETTFKCHFADGSIVDHLKHSGSFVNALDSGIEEMLVPTSPPVESMYCVLEQDTLSTA